MSEETELPKALSDPMNTFLDLNEYMLDGIDHLRYVLAYSLWFGALISIASIGAFGWYLVEDGLSWLHLALAVVALCSVMAVYWSRLERPFIDDYRIFAWALHRASGWEPHPKVPQGPDPVSRLLSLLSEKDERFELLLEKKGDKLVRNAEVKGHSKKLHAFDAFFAADRPMTLSLDDTIPEGVTLLVRVVSKATVDDLARLKSDAEDVLQGNVSMNEAALRVILLQAGAEEFPSEVVEYAGKNWMEYPRTFDSGQYDWSSPVELIAESPSGVYNFGNCYFG